MAGAGKAAGGGGKALRATIAESRGTPPESKDSVLLSPGKPPAKSRSRLVLAALSAGPPGAAVAVIAGHARISVAAARQALLVHEKNGTATRVKGSRPGIADTWTLAVPEAPA